MLKGRNMVIYFSNNTHYLTQPGNTVIQQPDTIIQQNVPVNVPSVNSTIVTPQIDNQINSTPAQYSQSQVDSVLKRSERREQQIVTVTKVIVPPPPKKQNIAPSVDTFSTKYNGYNFPVSEISTPLQADFGQSLQNIQSKSYSIKNQLQGVAKSSTIASNNTTLSTNSLIIVPKGLKGTLKSEVSMNWLVLTVLFSLFVFSWLRVTYQKYIIQIVGSVVNYQLSNRLFRERNVLFKNVSAGLNFIFALNLGIFVFYIIDYFQLSQILENKFLSTCIYTVAILAVYALKTIVCKFLGYVFLVQDEFDEYLHNVNLFNKNIGLILFPVVVLYPFINDIIKPVILYSGLFFAAGLFILRLHRGFQIIMKKGISFFYLILYLCAIEILPVLILLKFTGVLI